MQYAGTIGVEEATFEALLTDICRSYETHGFIDMVLIGDSGGNQAGMAKVADALNRKWSAERARVHYLREYYEEDKWSYGYLKSLGITRSTGRLHQDNHRIARPIGVMEFTMTSITRRRSQFKVHN